MVGRGLWTRRNGGSRTLRPTGAGGRNKLRPSRMGGFRMLRAPLLYSPMRIEVWKQPEQLSKTTLSYGRTLNILILRIVMVQESGNGRERVSPRANGKLFFGFSGCFHNKEGYDKEGSVKNGGIM